MVPSKILSDRAAELPTSSTSSVDVAESPTPSTSSADVRSPVIAAPVGGFELTGAVGGWIDPGVAPVHPGRGELENKTTLSSLSQPRVRFNTEVEVRTFVPVDAPTVHWAMW